MPGSMSYTDGGSAIQPNNPEKSDDTDKPEKQDKQRSRRHTSILAVGSRQRLGGGELSFLRGAFGRRLEGRAEGLCVIFRLVPHSLK